jgi:kynurenine formamidase
MSTEAHPTPRPGGGPPPALPDEKEVFGYFESLSNWNRWGEDDQMGTLNLITEQHRRDAAALVQYGRSVGCARVIGEEAGMPDVAVPPLHFMVNSGEATEPSRDGRKGSTRDFIGMHTHGLGVSHVDALSHAYWDDRLYNGYHRSRIRTATGAEVLAVDTMRDGVVTRGVLLDVAGHRGIESLEPGEAVLPGELEEIEQACGVRVQEGDALLVRTGWSRRRARRGFVPDRPRDRPGLHAACLPWLHERGVAVIVSDSANDVFPSGYPTLTLPVHAVGIVAMGLHLIDNCQFEDVAEVCREIGRWAFLFVVAPLRFHGATGSPATPLAVY